MIVSLGGDTPYSALYYISDYAVYSLYDPSTYLNDIAILATTTQITFSTYVGPICLPFRYYQSDFADETAIILGKYQNCILKVFLSEFFNIRLGTDRIFRPHFKRTVKGKFECYIKYCL